jgi:hypothetical protein
MGIFRKLKGNKRDKTLAHLSEIFKLKAREDLVKM